jgi:aryl-alcohol dehydrogenase-like predicted oxidoreductase
VDRRTLGGQGLHVSAIGLGTMGVTGYGTPDDAEAVATIRHALDLGVNFLDTSDVYASGHSEQLVGEAMRGRRGDVVVATKVGNLLEPDGSFGGVDGRPEHVIEACEDSLRRLGTDVIDLYYLHRVDPDTPIEDTFSAMSELVQVGSVRFLGISEAAPETIRRAHAVHPVSALQTELSLLTRDVEEHILPTCRELGIGFVAYSPLGRGFLTRVREGLEDLAEHDHRRKFPRFQEPNLSRNLDLVGRLDAVARGKGCTLAQLALAWVLSRGEDVVPIPGTKHRGYLEENLGALDVQLNDDDLRTLDELAPLGRASGLRYHPAGMRKLGV